MTSLLGVSVVALVNAPGLVALGMVGLQSIFLGLGGRQTAPLVIHDDHVVAKGATHSLKGVTSVRASLTEVWLDRGTSKATVFTGRHAHLGWVASLRREVLHLGHIPIELMLPPARIATDAPGSR